MKRVGVIGGGQLAWMMAEAAAALGIELIVQTPNRNDPAVEIAANAILAEIDNAAATAKLAACCDVITFENEFVGLNSLLPLAQQGVCFRPSLATLSHLLDKYHQRCYLREIRLPVPQFSAWTNEIAAEFTFPAVLKARRHGYDGQGTFIVNSQEDLIDTYKRLQAPAMVEAWVPFERELATIAARSLTGDIVVYPVVETQQVEQVCRRVFVPAHLSPALQQQIEAMARTLLTRLEGVGVFGIELFLTRDEQILVNEVAPRTHNSGHYTLDACETSQFEMQLRCVAGLSLGSPKLKSDGAVMVNLLGYEYSQNDYQDKRDRLAAIPRAYVHWYGKNESRPGRKLGHVTVLLTEAALLAARQVAHQIEAIWYE